MLRAAGTTVEWWIDQHRQLNEWLVNHPDDADEGARRTRRFLNDIETSWFNRRRALPSCVAGRAVPVGTDGDHLTIALFRGRIRVCTIPRGEYDLSVWWGGGRGRLWYRAGDVERTVFDLIPDLLTAVEAAALFARM